MRKVLAMVLLLLVILSSVRASPKTVIVVANSIDKPQKIKEHLEEAGFFAVEIISAEEFEEYSKVNNYFVILGGPDAPEGIGDVVKGILPLDEQEKIRASGACEIFSYKKDGKTYVILAGSDREQTKEAVTKFKHEIFAYIPRDPIAWLEDYSIDDVTAMEIADLDNNGVYDYIFAHDEVIILEDRELKGYYPLSKKARANSIKAYDLDSDGQKEIIVACEGIFSEPNEPASGYILVFNERENSKDLALKWKSSPVHGAAKLLCCFGNRNGNFVAVFSYKTEDWQPGEGQITIFNQDGVEVNSFDAGGDISKLEVIDIDNDGEEEVIVSGIHDAMGGHSLRIYDLEGGELWKYKCDLLIKDFQCHDIDKEGILEIALATDTYLRKIEIVHLDVIEEGEHSWTINLQRPIWNVKIINEEILVTCRMEMYLFDFFGSELSKFPRRLTYLRPKFLFLIDIDHDGSEEILIGDGFTLEIYELLELKLAKEGF